MSVSTEPDAMLTAPFSYLLNRKTRRHERPYRLHRRASLGGFHRRTWLADRHIPLPNGLWVKPPTVG